MSERMRLRVANVTRALDDDDTTFAARVATRLGLVAADISNVRVMRRSVDARGRRAPRFMLSVDVDVPADALPLDALPNGVRASPTPPSAQHFEGSFDGRPVIIGMGPCGLFAALAMVRSGLRPIILDRGKAVEPRAKDVSRLMNQGTLNGESNLCYGEGGAGTWSDGKLYTRVGGALIRPILEEIVAHGGPERILVDARPHLGTDRLVALLKALRQTLIDAGCDVVFDARVTAIEHDERGVRAVTTHDGTRYDSRHVVLAVGHSARSMYSLLRREGVAMKAKPFAVGFRIEHRQALIDTLQYGEWAEHEALPAAYYELKAQAGERGVYSFCMCPGGSVVPTPTRERELCVNGMSHAARSGHFANSALVVSVTPEDYQRWTAADDPTMAGIAFQRAAEEEAWRLGGGAYVAPAQRVSDFAAGRASREVRRTSYKRGVSATDLSSCYPDAVNAALRQALRRFGDSMPGFVSDDAVVIGVESRTSAPVTVLRDAQSLESPSMAGLYPAGEGAGFGGGIVSAAVDGIRVAHAIMTKGGMAAVDRSQ